MRLVLDANVIVSALIRPQGPPGLILKHLLEQNVFELVLSAAISEEYRRCLSYPKVRKYVQFSDAEIELTVTSLELLAHSVNPTFFPKVVLDDPDDDKYLAAALEGRAEFIVSGDQHLLGIQQYETIQIVTPADFWQRLLKPSGNP